ncbi:MAG TPA: 4'-phosphopantetheinyl transferase superfamily protein, partial [Luteimonas sp.]
ALAIGRGRHGRPHLRHGRWDCNWSHSGDRLAIALGEDVRVGIDIERPRPRPRVLELAGRYFAPAEAAALAALPEDARADAFLRLWCAKEAVLKAHGRGLAFGLHRLCFDGFDDPCATPRPVAMDPALGLAGDWHLRRLPFDGLVGMLAWHAAGPRFPGPARP